jgi:uncharacterized surface protein with fasciclin (FAS1) repeats
MKKALLKTIVVIFVVIYGCELDPLEKEIYQKPEWLAGSILETLIEREDYSIFIELIEKAQYTEAIDKNPYTVFAANDSAYKVYFKERGIDSVGQLSRDEAFRIVTLNLINSPRSRRYLVYTHEAGEWQDSASEYGALFFRWHSRSRSLIQTEEVKYNRLHQGKTLYIRGDEKRIPLFSREFFRDNGGKDDGSDYNFFFPNTPWTTLQWYNAAITESEVRCSNGYIYFLDRVVPIMPSIEEYLRNNQDKYGTFYDIAQRFANYSNAGYSDDGKFIPYYKKSYNGIMDFANEEGPSAGWYSRRYTYSAFIPTNEAMDEYLNNTVYKYYESIDSVPMATLIFLLQGHLAQNYVLKSKIERNEFHNAYGDNIIIDLDKDIQEATFLSNGAFYGMNKVLEPLAFQTVPGPLFFNSNYTTFLFALNKSEILSSLSLADVPVTIFAPSDEKLEAYGIRYDKVREELQVKDNFGEWAPMNYTDLQQFVHDHIILEPVSDLSKEGFLIMNSGAGVYVNNNKLIAGGNREDNDQAGVAEAIDSKVNGVLFLLDNVIKSPEQNFAMYMSKNPDFSEVYNLFYEAGMLDTIIDAVTLEEFPRLGFLGQYDYWTAFIPDNEAIQNARSNSLIPAESNELKQFLRYHFVADTLVFDIDPFDYSVNTSAIDSIGQPEKLKIKVNSKDMVLTDEKGNAVPVDHGSANQLVFDGVAHKIKSVLIAE